MAASNPVAHGHDLTMSNPAWTAGGLNIEGKDVDACINNGTDCGLPAADAWCKYIGFDGATPDMAQTAPTDQPVRAVTGALVYRPAWCFGMHLLHDARHALM